MQNFHPLILSCRMTMLCPIQIKKKTLARHLLNIFRISDIRQRTADILTINLLFSNVYWFREDFLI